MQTLLKKHDANSIGLIGHTIINYPTPELCRESIKAMVEEGVDLIELQIPFSEPVADGPLFMAANHAALAAGVTVDQCFELIKEVAAKYSTPFVIMTYANIIYKAGYETFVKRAKAAGAKGIIAPDLSFENAADYLALCRQYDLATIQLIPPNVTAERFSKIIATTTGFVYLVARAGVTGAKTEFGEQLAKFIERIKQETDLPIAVGFGVATPADIKFLKPYADYAIVGSQALRILQEQGLAALQQFWQSMRTAAN